MATIDLKAENLRMMKIDPDYRRYREQQLQDYIKPYQARINHIYNIAPITAKLNLTTGEFTSQPIEPYATHIKELQKQLNDFIARDFPEFCYAVIAEDVVS